MIVFIVCSSSFYIFSAAKCLLGFCAGDKSILFLRVNLCPPKETIYINYGHTTLCRLQMQNKKKHICESGKVEG